MRSPKPEPDGELEAQLEASLLRELSRRYHDFNVSFFEAALKRPVFELTDSEHFLGRFEGHRRRIAISRPFAMTASWGSVLEVLKHEMAHQFVYEVLAVTDEAPHGATFKRVCERLGFDALPTGTPLGAPEDEERVRLLRRVSDLLALAESPNQNEAENAAAAAQKLMLRHNIELCSRQDRLRYGFRYVGEPKGRRQESEHLLAAILAEHFFVEAIWVSGYRPQDGKKGSVLELCGTPENLEIACYVHGFLIDTAERLWKEHKRAFGIKKNRDRRAFIAGVMEGFSQRLARSKRAAEEKGMVWVGDADLKHYYRGRHPHVRSVRLQGHGMSPARGHGQNAGRNIVLRKGVKGAAKRSTRALLPSKS